MYFLFVKITFSLCKHFPFSLHRSRRRRCLLRLVPTIPRLWIYATKKNSSAEPKGGAAFCLPLPTLLFHTFIIFSLNIITASWNSAAANSSSFPSSVRKFPSVSSFLILNHPQLPLVGSILVGCFSFSEFSTPFLAFPRGSCVCSFGIIMMFYNTPYVPAATRRRVERIACWFIFAFSTGQGNTNN